MRMSRGQKPDRTVKTSFGLSFRPGIQIQSQSKPALAGRSGRHFDQTRPRQYKFFAPWPVVGKPTPNCIELHERRMNEGNVSESPENREVSEDD
jgi:hypothetical protein